MGPDIHLPRRSPVLQVTRLAGDGSEHPDHLSLREFRLLPRADVTWQGAPATLRFRRHHDGVAVNAPATRLIEAAEALVPDEIHCALPIRGAAYLGGSPTWFYNLAVRGERESLLERIAHLTFAGPVTFEFLTWTFDDTSMELQPWHYASCPEFVDFVALRLALSG